MDIYGRERLATTLPAGKRRRAPVKPQAFALAPAANGMIASSGSLAGLQDRSSRPKLATQGDAARVVERIESLRRQRHAGQGAVPIVSSQACFHRNSAKT